MKFLLSIIISILPFSIFACSAFFSSVGESMFFAKNFDWYSGQGYIIKNNRDTKKIAYGLRGTNQASWISKYGSITFNQIGKEFPYGGINEKGLVVEQLWMAESMYKDNKNETISELEWIQYQLDNYTSVDEVIAHINELTIKPIATIHYFMADKKGNAAVIDFVEGKTTIHKKQHNFQVITNEFFTASEQYYTLNKGSVDTSSRTHFDRYCQIKNKLSNMQVDNHHHAFEILDQSAEIKPAYKTCWTIVYDVSNLQIHFKTFDEKSIKTIHLSDFDFNSNTNITALNVNTKQTNFEEYTLANNSRLFKTAMKMMSLKMDETLGAMHQMHPSEHRIDKVYQENYIDLTIRFQSKAQAGNIYYAIITGADNFKKRKGIKSGVFTINKVDNTRMVYALPKGEYAIACFQDANFDNRLDTKIFGIPKNYGFSRNKRGILGTPPKYRDAKMNVQTDTGIIIKIM